jgi:hypothetical protein
VQGTCTRTGTCTPTLERQGRLRGVLSLHEDQLVLDDALEHVYLVPDRHQRVQVLHGREDAEQPVGNGLDQSLQQLAWWAQVRWAGGRVGGWVGEWQVVR